MDPLTIEHVIWESGH